MLKYGDVMVERLHGGTLEQSSLHGQTARK